MTKYIRKSYPVIATQWFKLGDHEKVNSIKFSRNKPCWLCRKEMMKHGTTIKDGRKVEICPGDWIIEDIQNKIIITIMSDYEFKFEYEKYEELTNDRN